MSTPRSRITKVEAALRAVADPVGSYDGNRLPEAEREEFAQLLERCSDGDGPPDLNRLPTAAAHRLSVLIIAAGDARIRTFFRERLDARTWASLDRHVRAIGEGEI